MQGGKEINSSSFSHTLFYLKLFYTKTFLLLNIFSSNYLCISEANKPEYKSKYQSSKREIHKVNSPQPFKLFWSFFPHLHLNLLVEFSLCLQFLFLVNWHKICRLHLLCKILSNNRYKFDCCFIVDKWLFCLNGY